jgi:hypothetical protein
LPVFGLFGVLIKRFVENFLDVLGCCVVRLTNAKCPVVMEKGAEHVILVESEDGELM